MAKTIPTGRLDEIERRILAAEAPGDFVPELAKKWSRTKRSIWSYVARVRAKLAERAKAVDPEADRETVRAMALETYRLAREGTEDGPDTRGMVAAAKLFGEITGAVAPKRFEVTGKGGGAIEAAVVARVVVLPPVADERSLSDPPVGADPAASAVSREPG